MAMKPKTPKPYQFTKPTPKPKYKLPAKPAPGSYNDPVSKALKFFLGDQTKPSKKKTAPKTPGIKVRGTPVPLPGIKGTDGKRPLPLIGGGRGLTPVPMPRINPGPRTRKPAAPAGPKKKSPTFKFPAPKRKK